MTSLLGTAKGRLLVAVLAMFVCTGASCDPVLESVAPSHGDPLGGGLLTLRGQRLADGSAKVEVGAATATIESRTGGAIDARIPPGPIGRTEVRLTIDGRLVGARPFVYRLERVVTVARADEAGLVEKAGLDARKQQLLADVQPLGVTVLADHEDLPTLVLAIPSEEALRAVEAHPSTVGITEKLKVEPATAESLPLVRQHQLRHLPEPPGGSHTGAGVTVMVIDSGVDLDNPFFRCGLPGQGACRVARMLEFAADDQMDDDPELHGTNVAAIVLSVAPDARIIAADVFGAGGTSDAVIAAVQWAIDNRAAYDIAAVNMSIGFYGKMTRDICYTDPVAAAVSFARFHGLVMVAATGNTFETDRTQPPACAPGVIRVGAVNDADPRLDDETDFSNAWSWPYMAAPGSWIEAAGLRMQGTSQAAPHVAGAAAVLRGAYPSASVEFIRRRLESTGPPLRNPRNRNGYPRRLDVYAAVEGQMNRPAPQPPEFEWTWAQDLEGGYWVADRPRLQVEPNPRFAADRRTRLVWARFLPDDPAPERVSIRTAQAHCNGLGLAPGWRLPTRSELMSLFDMSAPVGERLDRRILGPVPNGPLWTLSPSDHYGEEGLGVWTVDSETGYVAQASPGAYSATGGFVCVSAHATVPQPGPATRFKDEGTSVRDAASGLRWLKATGPQQTAREGAAWCAARTDASRRWRLPTAKELLSLVGVVQPALDTTLFGAPEVRVSLSDYPTAPGETPGYRWWRLDEQHRLLMPGGESGTVRCVENLDPKARPDRVHVGEVHIGGDGADAAYQRFVGSGYREVRGDLIVEASDLPRISLQTLERIDGSLFIGGLTEASLLALPNLREVTGGIHIEGNPEVRRIDLGGLKLVGSSPRGGDLRVADHPKLGADQPSGTNGGGFDAALRLPQLEEVRGSVQLHRTGLKAFEAPWLTAVGRDLAVTENGVLERFRFPRLATVGGRCPFGQECGRFEVGLNRTISSFSASLLTELRWGLDVQNNARLDGFATAILKAPALFRVIRNPALCAATAVDGRLRIVVTNGPIADIEVRDNMPDTVERKCASRCPDENACAWHPGGGSSRHRGAAPPRAACTAGRRTSDPIAATCTRGGVSLGRRMREAGVPEGGRGG